MSGVKKVSRRRFLQTTGLAGSALILGVRTGRTSWVPVPGLDSESGVFEPNVWVSIGEDGIVRLTVHRQEMGQGARTACCVLLSEELEVDLGDVEVIQALGEPKYGNQATGGSTTIRLNWLPLRRAGASAREMLVEAAARSWGVPAGDCRAESGAVLHGAKRLTYGELAAAAAEVPVPESPTLKSPADFKLIGKPHRLLDVEDMVR